MSWSGFVSSAGIDTVEEFWGLAQLEEMRACRFGSAERATADFKQAFAAFLGVPPTAVGLYRHARSALSAYLAQLPSSERKHVLLSAFNCPVVLESVLAQGFDVELYDMAEPNGKFSVAAIQERLSPSTAAVIIPHLFGVPLSVGPLIEAARHRNIPVIEDCAGTLGGKVNGCMAGTIGDASIFSFNYDKPLSLAGGGALVVNTHHYGVSATADEAPLLNFEKDLEEVETFRRFLIDRRWKIGKPAGLLRRLFKQVPGARRALRLLRRMNNTPLTTEPFGISGIGPLRAAIGLWQLERLNAISSTRNSNAKRLEVALPFPTWHVDQDCKPMFLKQKILLPSRQAAARIERESARRGIRIGRFNWPVPLRVNNRGYGAAHALRTCQCSLDLPVHQNLTGDSLNRILELFPGGVRQDFTPAGGV